MLGACADVALGPDPSDDPITNFDHLWSEFDRYYSYFVFKQIDWDALYDVYRPQVDPTAPRPSSSA